MSCKFYKKVYENHIKDKYLIGKVTDIDKYFYTLDYIEELKNIYSVYCDDKYCKVECNNNFCIEVDTYVYKKCAPVENLEFSVVFCNDIDYTSDVVACNDVVGELEVVECNNIEGDIDVVLCSDIDYEGEITGCHDITSITGVIYDLSYFRRNEN